jgi:hypothetical protein
VKLLVLAGSLMAWLARIAENEIRDRADYHARQRRDARLEVPLEVGLSWSQIVEPVGFIKQNGEILSLADLAYHISGIISGIYSLEGLEDRAMIEALIHPDPVFAAVTYLGVPDIRIVVYRGVPAMGMVRLPTRDSDGKANQR